MLLPQHKRRERLYATLFFGALGSSLCSAQVTPQGSGPAAQETVESRSFSIPDSRATRALWAAAEEHIAARRWSEALTSLQELLEDRTSALLGGQKLIGDNGSPGQQPTHAGAALRVRERLFQLPAEAQKLYRERYEGPARASFESARAHRDRRALAALAQRWPLTTASTRAWWALGDLELEEGRASEARLAWKRAVAQTLGQSELALASARDWRQEGETLERDQHAPGARARCEAAAASLEEQSSGATHAERETFGSLALAGPGQGGGPPPSRESSSWAHPYPLGDNPYAHRDNLFLVRRRDTLFASTGLRLIALDAYSGTLRWDSGDAPGWSRLGPGERTDYFKGIDSESALVAPAAGERVAVAALQLPIAFVENAWFQQIPITTKIPERRLFAFDADSGAPLWDHRPGDGWDGESGAFAERMNVAGPPVIVGRRLIAPFYRLQGRLYCQVGCFDVETGELLWSSELISGQRELNMFGRPEKEYCAPPVCVKDDRVLALTQLGTLACLDLFTGEVRWQALYEQQPLSRNSSFRPAITNRHWRNTPPVVSGSTVIAAPYDGVELVGYDIDNGAHLWSLPVNVIHGLANTAPNSPPDLLLLGASERTVFLSGSKLFALESPSGLHHEPPHVRKWIFEHEDLRSGQIARPLLLADRIVIPALSQRVDVDLESGRPIGAAAWSGGGNLLAGRGELFTISQRQVNGWFEWEAMLARARAAVSASHGDARAEAELADLLWSSAKSESERGKSDLAKSRLGEARGLLEGALARAASQGDATLKNGLYRVLRLEAHVLGDLADSAGSLRALRAARALAADPSELEGVLLEELALLRGQSDPRNAEHAEVLDLLEHSCGDLALACTLVVPGESESAATESLPRYQPLIGMPAPSDAPPINMPTGLWVLFERELTAARAQDSAGEFVALHTLLARYDEVELGDRSAGVIARERIARLLREGRRVGYERFEREAAERLGHAGVAQDRELLREIARLYPGSAAALQANDQRLTLGAEAGDAAEIARIVSSELPRAWNARTASERELRLVLELAGAFEHTGNRELASALLRSIARARPDSISPLALHAGKKLSELAQALPALSPPARAPTAGAFHGAERSAGPWRGNFHMLGMSYGGSAADKSADKNGKNGDTPPRLCVAGLEQRATRWSISAFDPRAPLEPAWSLELALDRSDLGSDSDSKRWRSRTAFAAGRLLVVLPHAVVGIDVANGEPAFEWQAASAAEQCQSLVCSSGVAIVLVRMEDERQALVALDAHSGTELWRASVPDERVRALPLLSAEHAVFLPSLGRQKLFVLDLFRGVSTGEFTLGSGAPDNWDESAFIAGERLVLPWFDARNAERNAIEAWDLETDTRAWRVGFSEPGADPRVLAGILQCGERAWLYTKPGVRVEPDSPRALAQLTELELGIGATAPLSNVRLALDERIFGLKEKTRVRLPLPQVLVLSPNAKTLEMRLRAIDLTRGEQWSANLRARANEVSALQLPLPSISSDLALTAWTMYARSNQRGDPQTVVTLLDPAHGLLREDSRVLEVTLGKCDGLEFWPIGDALMVRGEKQVEIWR